GVLLMRLHETYADSPSFPLIESLRGNALVEEVMGKFAP
ncbi:hypothetical protein CEXT_734131, partial [Caerostris extrusa]